jgi:hypothetical protein
MINWIRRKLGLCVHQWRFSGNVITTRGARGLAICDHCKSFKIVNFGNAK